MKFTDTQLVLLSAASQRPDRALLLTDKLKGAAAAKTTRRLLDGSLVEEVAATGGLPIWRRSDEGEPLALIVTDEGLRAIGVEPESLRTEPAHPATAKSRGRSRANTRRGSSVDPGHPSTAARTARKRALAPKDAGNSAGPSSVRTGTKTAQLLGLLERPKGASIDQIVATLGWLPHTTRAALTGLRKRGYVIDRQKSAGRPTTYRTTAVPPAPGGARDGQTARPR